MQHERLGCARVGQCGACVVWEHRRSSGQFSGHWRLASGDALCFLDLAHRAFATCLGASPRRMLAQPRSSFHFGFSRHSAESRSAWPYAKHCHVSNNSGDLPKPVPNLDLLPLLVVQAFQAFDASARSLPHSSASLEQRVPGFRAPRILASSQMLDQEDDAPAPALRRRISSRRASQLENCPQKIQRRLPHASSVGKQRRRAAVMLVTGQCG